MDALSFAIGSEFDVRNLTTHGHHGIDAPAISIGWKLFVFLLLTCFSCMGNGLILMLLLRTPAIRSFTNIVIGGMAVVDFCRCIVFAGSMIGRSLGSNYLMGESWCHNENFVKLSFNTSVRLSIIAMVFGRLTNVFFPKLRLTSLKAKVAPVLLIWCFSWVFIFVLTRVFWVWSLHEVRHEDWIQTVCDVKDETGRGFWILYVFVLLYIPLFMLLLLYATVFHLTHRYSRALQLATGSGSQAGQQVHNYILLLYVMMAILSEIPAQYYIIRKYIRNPERESDVSSYLRIAQLTNHLFKCMDCCVNPVIFGFANQTFRKSLQSMWKKRPSIAQQI